MTQAENDFAAFSVSHTTKDAFLANMDTGAIVFDHGKPVNGIQTWTVRKKGTGVLNWFPVDGYISQANDFGYTTGPWTFRPSAKDSVAATGYYVTIWRMNQEKKWKFLLDIGVDAPAYIAPPVDSVKTHTSISVQVVSDVTRDVESAEKLFISLFNRDGAAAYARYVDHSSILYRNGTPPATDEDKQKVLIENTPTSLQYTIDGWIMAPLGDLACVYGTIKQNDKTENYIRIWKHELTSGWKIILELLRY